MENTKNEVLSREQTARYLGVSVTTLQTLTLPKIKLGRTAKYTMTTITKWLEDVQEGRIRSKKMKFSKKSDEQTPQTDNQAKDKNEGKK